MEREVWIYVHDYSFFGEAWLEIMFTLVFVLITGNICGYGG